MNGVELQGAPVFCSWSGGKDSALALHEAIRAGARPQLLVTMLTEDGTRSRSHGLHRSVLEAQAEALGLPIRFASAPWSEYERGFAELLDAAREAGAIAGVFGDIDIERHRDWVERMCGEADLAAALPLWQWDRGRVTEQLLESGFEATIIAVRDGVLPESLLGRTLDHTALEEIVEAGADAAGENGEYHSLVVDGPLFRQRLKVVKGEPSLHDGVWFLDLGVASATP